MARQKHFTNLDKGFSGSIRALSTNDLEKGDIVYISKCIGSRITVSPADAQYAKRSTGLLFVAERKTTAGYPVEFLSYMIVTYIGEGKEGDTLYLKKKGKWGATKTKTSKPIGKILGGRENELSALIAPQGQY